MLLNKIFLANFLIIVSNLFFISSLIPQILLNYKIKSTNGLSTVFILTLLNSGYFYLIYSFANNLPIGYKIINIIYTFLVSFIIFQRFKYSQNNLDKEIKFFSIFILNIFILFFIGYLIYFKFYSYAYLIGWIPVGIGFWKKLPQIFKIYRNKSVHGFSFYFILISLSANFCEISANFLLNIPIPLIVNNFRGILVNLVFLGQFFIYRNNQN